MSDVFSKEKRSQIMSKVKATGTKPELIVRRFLFSRGLRYRINSKILPGKPDVVLPKYRTVIFVNGCFWHGHIKCKNSTLPKSNKVYWVGKIGNNVRRDQKNIDLLKTENWNVIVIWECQIKDNLELILKEFLPL